MAAVNDTYQLSIIGRVGGQDHVHTLHFRVMDLAATPQGLIDSWQTGCRAAYRDVFYTYDSPVQTLRVSHACGSVPLAATVEETEVAPNIVGTRLSGGADGLPSYVATVVSVRTALSGPTRRGRFYLGGMNENDNAYNAIVAGHATLVQAYCTSLLNRFMGVSPADAQWRLVVHSRKMAAVPGTQCQNSSTPATGFLVRTEPGTMRSRKLGHGN